MLLFSIIKLVTAVISPDCPDLVNFAKGLNLHLLRPSIMSQLNNDCCSAQGITCDGNSRATIVDWYFQGLNGTINVTAIPLTLTRLALYRNYITGQVSDLTALTSLRELQLDWNRLSGNCPLFPTSLKRVYLGHSNYWLTPLVGVQNNITGTLKLHQPEDFGIHSNFITDIQIADTSQLVECDISQNPLFNNPNIVNLTMCTQKSLYIPSAVSLGCTNVAVLAKGLNMNTVLPWLMAQVIFDCCNAFGIKCNEHRHVVEIQWASLGLTGMFVGSLPETLLQLELANNAITGRIPQSWPANLTVLSVGNNRLTGSIPIVWPEGLVKIHLDSNYLYGDISNIPSEVKILNLGYPGRQIHSHFTGKLVLNKPTNVLLNDNWITDINILNSSFLTSCDISNNPLLGNPNIVNLTMCIQNHLYDAIALQDAAPTVTVELQIWSTIEQQCDDRATTEAFLSTSATTTTSPGINSFVYLGTHTNTLTSISESSIEYIFGAQPIQKAPSIELTTIKLGIRILIDVILLTIVIGRTPYLREYKRRTGNSMTRKSNY